MLLRHLLVVAVSCLAGVPAQNFILPGQWKPGPVNPTLANIRYDNATRLNFNPACQATTPCAPRPWTGIYQDVNLPQAGIYHLEFHGVGGGTGELQFEIVVDKQVLWKFSHEGEICFTDGVQLSAGLHRIEFRSITTSYQFPDDWDFQPPILKRALGPVLQMRGYVISNAGPVLTVAAPANLIAVSWAEGMPIRLPGVQHFLELDTSSMVVLGMSPTTNPGLNLDLGKMMPPWVLYYPRFWVQAASWTAFGPAAPTTLRR